MIAEDEIKFRRRRNSIRCLINCVLREVSERLIYEFEDGRPPLEDIEEEKEWNRPDSPLPGSP